ncbi:hypothetical protein ACOI1C_06455 [Bacillus sp. DJP31]|uniref:hypothetical protein n=1 Tax=Bacillus sp. DJP31 TaxID=3409789 RepID=UPI003BB4B25D
MSHKLQVGEMRAEYLTDKDVWSHFNYIFSPKSKNSTTYKFVLIKSIIENLYNVNDRLELSYDSLFSSFAKIYWNLVIHHNLNQINMIEKKSEVQKILLEPVQKGGQKEQRSSRKRSLEHRSVCFVYVRSGKTS